MPVSEDAVREQQVAYTALLQSLGTATFPAIEEALADREVVTPEVGLTPEVVERLRKKARLKTED